MLRKLLYANSNLPVIIIILVIIITWSRAFTNSAPMLQVVTASPLYDVLFICIGSYPILCKILSLLLITIEAFLINHLLTENELIPRNSYIAAFLFIIFSGLFNEFINLNPILIVNLFIITAIWLFMRLYNLQETYSVVLNIGTLIGIASMFYFPAILFIILIWIGFIINRMIKWREWLISIIGLIIPYFFLTSYYFWFDKLDIKFKEYQNALQIIDFNSFSPTVYTYISIIFIGILLIFSILKLLSIINEKAIRIRKLTSFIIWYMLCTFILLLFSKNYHLLGGFMIFTPLSIIITIFVNNFKKSFWFEGILWILIVLIVSNQVGLWNLI